MNNPSKSLADVKKMVEALRDREDNCDVCHREDGTVAACWKCGGHADKFIPDIARTLLHLISDHEKMRDSLKELRESGCNTEKCECCPVVEENSQETLLQLHYNE